MKVVNITTNDEGGAYYATLRISEALKTVGVESSVLLRNKMNNDNEGTEVCSGFVRVVSKAKNLVNLLLSTAEVQMDFLAIDITKQEKVLEADVVILHWTNSFVSYHGIKKLSKLGKPIVWVMHDMWLLTGGCHYDCYCGRYHDGCINCVYTKGNLKKFIIKKTYKLKKNLINKVKPVLVMPSTWMKNCAELSDITKDCIKQVIPNPIDLRKIYYTEEKPSYLDEIIKGKKVILFSALNALENKNKGYGYLYKAMELISEDNYLLFVSGTKEKKEFDIGKVHVVCLGTFKNANDMCKIYSMADVFVAPSKQDNYSNSVVEAMSCGVPAVAFNIGGMTDLIQHKVNGYIVPYEDIDELKEGIVYCCNNKDALSPKARLTREETNSYEVIGRCYKDLCENLIEGRYESY